MLKRTMQLKMSKLFGFGELSECVIWEWACGRFGCRLCFAVFFWCVSVFVCVEYLYVPAWVDLQGGGQYSRYLGAVTQRCCGAAKVV